MSNAKQAVQAPAAPPAIGPYTPAVRIGNLLYTSGQVGFHPQTGNLVEGGIEAETRQVLTNLKNLLEAGGASLRSVVKTTVFLQRMSDFAAMNAIYAEFLQQEGTVAPARSTVEVAGLPRGAAIEIEAIALVD
jgi:2-iminobutanoate/2-iminopropanoate deaminase